MLKEFTLNNDNKHILCYMNGKHHIDLFYNIFIANQDYIFYIYSPQITIDEYIKTSLYNIKNVIFVSNLQKLLYKLPAFGCFITTDAQLCLSHSKSLMFINIFNKLEVPTIELQHGLFQLGMHYENQPENIGPNCDTFCFTSYADYTLSYYGKDSKTNFVIGYPKYNQDIVNNYKGQYTLILSNCHWNAYTDLEKHNFYMTVAKYIENNPNKKFIWKFHHGETENIQFVKILLGKNNNNLIIANEDNILKFITVSDMIKKSQDVISTISTVLLESEMYQKTTYIYQTKSVDCVINKLHKKSLFSNYKELLKLTRVNKGILKTGCLYKYDNQKFRDVINKNYKLTSLPNKDILEILQSMKL